MSTLLSWWIYFTEEPSSSCRVSKRWGDWNHVKGLGICWYDLCICSVFPWKVIKAWHMHKGNLSQSLLCVWCDVCVTHAYIPNYTLTVSLLEYNKSKTLLVPLSHSQSRQTCWQEQPHWWTSLISQLWHWKSFSTVSFILNCCWLGHLHFSTVPNLLKSRLMFLA